PRSSSRTGCPRCGRPTPSWWSRTAGSWSPGPTPCCVPPGAGTPSSTARSSPAPPPERSGWSVLLGGLGRQLHCRGVVVPAGHRPALVVRHTQLVGAQLGSVGVVAERRDRGGRLSGARGGVVLGVHLVRWLVLRVALVDEIGRASCRGRGWAGGRGAGGE